MIGFNLKPILFSGTTALIVSFCIEVALFRQLFVDIGYDIFFRLIIIHRFIASSNFSFVDVVVKPSYSNILSFVFLFVFVFPGS